MLFVPINDTRITKIQTILSLYIFLSEISFAYFSVSKAMKFALFALILHVFMLLLLVICGVDGIFLCNELLSI